jgi:predicted CXXCH cytochrome family protein
VTGRRLAGIATAAALACGAPRSASPPAAPAEQAPRLTEAEILAVKNPHAAKPRPFCWSCHASDTRVELRGDPVALCQRCHGASPHGSHPVDAVQTRPAGALPLWKGDRMVCHTCHDPHDVARNADGLRLAFDPLCVECHRPAAQQHHGVHAGGHGKRSPDGRPSAGAPR